MDNLKISSRVLAWCVLATTLWIAVLCWHTGMALLIVACLPALTVAFIAINALISRKTRLPGKPQGRSYRQLVRFLIGFGVLTWAGGILRLIAGAGIYGSPISADAFQVDPRTGFTDYWSFWMIFVVVGGPIALFPCAVIERFAPGVGAVALIVSGTFVAEAGIRASRMFWGFSDEDAFIVIAFISAPMLFLAGALFFFERFPISQETNSRWLDCAMLAGNWDSDSVPDRQAILELELS